MTTTPPTRTALITGASAGIGKAFAEVFASEGWNVVLVARREDRLRDIAIELEERFAIRAHVMVADLSHANAPQQIDDALAHDGIQVDALVNNAGYGLRGEFTSFDWDEHRDFIQVMMTSLTELCYRFGKEMKTRRYGRIINVASVAAFSPELKGNLYNAAKSYVVHLSEALDLEFKDHGVHVTALCPGFTYSEFHDVMGVRKAMNALPKLLWMDANDVAREGFDAVMKGEAARVTGVVNKALVQAFRWMPRRLKYRMAKRQKLM